ncbi:VOC family protein [Ochrobactrum sp. Q0168]|uniref:VOC family protein n=1 Tax=Ochrobactrum sp. Q0168 TaxID=2793241 RepID=UPI0018EB4D4D|nr:VOC family protein [Ochrobactrum sp. Q0168]
MTDQLFLGFHHYSIRCPNLPRSVSFYEALGFRQVHHWQLPQYSIEQAVMMQAPDHKSWIELFDLQATIPMQGNPASHPQEVVTGALAHICLTVSNLDLAVQRIVEAGATKLYGPETLELGTPAITVHNAIFEGIAGEIIELLEPVTFPGDISDV